MRGCSLCPQAENPVLLIEFEVVEVAVPVTVAVVVFDPKLVVVAFEGFEDRVNQLFVGNQGEVVVIEQECGIEVVMPVVEIE